MFREGHVPLTQLLHDAGGGDAFARQQVWDLVYKELRAMARGQMAGEARGGMLQTTVLVHDAYQRLVGSVDGGFASRKEFFGAAAEAMRRIRVEDARRRKRAKRGGGRRIESLRVEPADNGQADDELLGVHEAMDGLEAEAPRPAQVVKLRYFGGMTHDEIGRMLDVSRRTVDNDWRFARAWLRRALEAD